MGSNLAPTIGRIRVTQSVANTLQRLRQDGDNAKAMAIRLEEELLGDDEEVKPEDEKLTGADGQGRDEERKVPGLREKGSDIIEEHVARLIESEGLCGSELDEEQATRRVRSSLLCT
jgi:uncharacterized protein involved in exopolysaccharide biosynthesis